MIGVGRPLQAFNGRMAAYEEGLNDPEKLDGALRRNVYGTVANEAVQTEPLAAYLLDCVRAVEGTPLQMVSEGRVIWPATGLKQSA